jgi:hypothetical protein
METREVVRSSKDMIEESFFALLKDPKFKQKKAEKIDLIEEPPKNYNTEELLLELYDTRDHLIKLCSTIDIDNSDTISDLTNSINKLGSCIIKVGGKVDNFDPMDNMSGLQSPNIRKNAERVIENTKQYYSLGKIEDSKIEDDKTIVVTFSGQRNNIKYSAKGTIKVENNWIGNEAIDYIWFPDSGKMTVKALNENNEWKDRSDDYNISWELTQEQIEKNVEENK